LSTIVTDAVTALSGNLALLPEGSGVVTIDGLTYPAADGSASQLMKTNGSGVLSFVDAPESGAWTYGTEIINSSASSNEFTSLPSTATDVDLLIRTMSFTGTVTATVVIGDGGGYETSGYSGDSSNYEGTSINAVTSGTSAWSLRTATGAASSYNGLVRLHRHDPSKFVYTQHHFLNMTAETNTHIGGTGAKTLTAVLDRIKISGGTFDGTTTFQIRYR
jgi:hypothetical protein